MRIRANMRLLGSASRSAKLSGMVQSVGYAVAAVCPLLTGFLFDISGTWRLPLLTALLMCVVLLVSGLRAGADDVALDAAIAQVWQQRDDRYSEIRTAETAARQKIEMSYIGG